MQSLKLSFVTDRGQRLTANLDPPAAPRSYALFAHCFTCSRNFRVTHFSSNVADVLAAARILEHDGEAEISVAGKSYRIGRGWLDGIAGVRMEDTIR